MSQFVNGSKIQGLSFSKWSWMFGRKSRNSRHRIPSPRLALPRSLPAKETSDFLLVHLQQAAKPGTEYPRGSLPAHCRLMHAEWPQLLRISGEAKDY